jgi:hypothetical protein
MSGLRKELIDILDGEKLSFYFSTDCFFAPEETYWLLCCRMGRGDSPNPLLGKVVISFTLFYPSYRA